MRKKDDGEGGGGGGWGEGDGKHGITCVRVYTKSPLKSGQSARRNGRQGVLVLVCK